MSEVRQQTVGIGATRSDARGDALADGIAVGKQAVENVDDGRADIAVFAQGARRPGAAPSEQVFDISGAHLAAGADDKFEIEGG